MISEFRFFMGKSGRTILATTIVMFFLGVLVFILQNADVAVGKASAKTKWKETWEAKEMYYTGSWNVVAGSGNLWRVEPLAKRFSKPSPAYQNTGVAR